MNTDGHERLAELVNDALPNAMPLAALRNGAIDPDTKQSGYHYTGILSKHHFDAQGLGSHRYHGSDTIIQIVVSFCATPGGIGSSAPRGMRPSPLGWPATTWWTDSSAPRVSTKRSMLPATGSSPMPRGTWCPATFQPPMTGGSVIASWRRRCVRIPGVSGEPIQPTLPSRIGRSWNSARPSPPRLRAARTPAAFCQCPARTGRASKGRRRCVRKVLLGRRTQPRSANQCPCCCRIRSQPNGLVLRGHRTILPAWCFQVEMAFDGDRRLVPTSSRQAVPPSAQGSLGKCFTDMKTSTSHSSQLTIEWDRQWFRMDGFLANHAQQCSRQLEAQTRQSDAVLDSQRSSADKSIATWRERWLDEKFPRRWANSFPDTVGHSRKTMLALCVAFMVSAAALGGLVFTIGSHIAAGAIGGSMLLLGLCTWRAWRTCARICQQVWHTGEIICPKCHRRSLIEALRWETSATCPACDHQDVPILNASMSEEAVVSKG